MNNKINGLLDHIIHPQGILRPTPPGANNSTEFVYDFFIKDYLGNVRVVLTEEDVQFDSGPPVVMVATMELDSASSLQMYGIGPAQNC